jgi:virulence-associated protein VagC
MSKKFSKELRSPPTTEASRAKLFANGRSQAVRLPRAFRFEGDEVSIRREGDAVILEPVKKRDWPKGYWARMARLKRDLELGDVRPLGGALLDLPGEG